MPRMRMHWYREVSKEESRFFNRAISKNVDLCMAWMALTDLYEYSTVGYREMVFELWRDLNRLLSSRESQSFIKRKGTLS